MFFAFEAEIDQWGEEFDEQNIGRENDGRDYFRLYTFANHDDREAWYREWWLSCNKVHWTVNRYLIDEKTARDLQSRGVKWYKGNAPPSTAKPQAAQAIESPLKELA